MSDDSTSEDDGETMTDNDDNDASANEDSDAIAEDDIADANEDADDDIGDFQIFTIDELLKLGLRMVRYRSKRIRRAKRETNLNRFRKHFGSSPLVCALIWEDLQTTKVRDAWVPPDSRRIEYLLMAMHHLKLYPKEYEREAMWDVSEMWGRDWVWYFVEKIQALKEEKITWPEDFGEDIWILTVDGTHCWIQEPKHPTWSQDKAFFSHKYGKAGVNYELAISLTESRLPDMDEWSIQGWYKRHNNFHERGTKGQTPGSWQERNWRRRIQWTCSPIEQPKCARFQGGENV
jgi:hypothetical protein